MHSNVIDNYQNFRATILNTGNLLEEFSKQHNDFLFRQSNGLLDRSEVYYDLSVKFLDSEISLGNIKGSGSTQEDMEKIYDILVRGLSLNDFTLKAEVDYSHYHFPVKVWRNNCHVFKKQMEELRYDFLDFCDKKFDDFLPDVIREYKPEWERDER